MNTFTNKRIQSIDLLRGLVILLMALDHVRDYFHYDSFMYDPSDLTQTTVPIFFTRFITHLCAPVFCFLAGTSAFFVGQKKDLNSLSVWLLKRGLWLIIVEFTIVNFGWYFKFNTTFIDLAVIWCLGASMIFLAGLIRLPKSMAILIALFFVFGHNLFDSFKPIPNDIFSKLWYVFHVEGEFKLGSLTVYSVYPLMPWIGLMTLGYFLGQLYLPTFNSKKRIKILYGAGILLLVLFLVFRISNLYGDLHPWTKQNSLTYSILSILKVTKYPPSFAFICITIGPALILLAAFENFKNSLSKIFITIGQVPMFFYVVHIYIIHVVAIFAALATGYQFSDMILNVWIPFSPDLKGYGFSLPIVYLVWLGILVVLYPITKKYNRYKKDNKDKWWLSYL
ncbi:DUF1624 domain-containing protein [Lacinutrix himadriensis]|uniref:DUF1624 domain-containing protein n=1 Tax=Lacinutrix himadriensis TaxID=641549 RepID=UPI0009FAAAB9|nr:heparan-alpha-glucosaminide N-acetyltransferase domain-containing protein [Lacinutrix himadriensis]